MSADTAALLDALRAVPGVASAEIEPDERPEGAGTLRLQLSAGADEVAVATSVNRVLREQFGLAVDANRVQVVEESVPVRHPAVPLQEPPVPVEATEATEQPQPAAPAEPEPDVLAPPTPIRPTLTALPGLGGQPGAVTSTTAEPPAPPAAPPTLPPAPAAAGTSPTAAPETQPARPPRVLIQKMQLVSAGLGVTTEVTLGWRGDAFTGSADASATPSSVHRSVAQATLRAVEAVIGGRARFELEQLELNQLGPDRAVIVVVSMLTRTGSERLTGVSVVREDVRQAVIRAALDALNRRIESVLLP